jgi:hypothetical protein
LKYTDVSEMRTGSIIRVIIGLIMEAVRISETSVYFNETALFPRRLPSSYLPP